MNKLKGTIIGLSIVLLALVVGIFIKEQKSFSKRDAEIKKVAIEKKTIQERKGN